VLAHGRAQWVTTTTGAALLTKMFDASPVTVTLAPQTSPIQMPLRVSGDDVVGECLGQ
jgi:hypothetical protein